MIRLLTAAWGIIGILLLLLWAVFRLFGRFLEATAFSWDWPHWAFLILWVPYMVYAEGYRGFHRAFAPRAVVRSRYFHGSVPPLHRILAPLVCMGFLHATPRRRAISIGVTLGIVALVLLVGLLPQPWRGLIDLGVVVGLVFGMTSILRLQWMNLRGRTPRIDPDFPTPPISALR